MSGEKSSTLKLLESQMRRTYSRDFDTKILATPEPSDFDNYDQYVEDCRTSGRSVRFSEKQFNSMKQRGMK